MGDKNVARQRKSTRRTSIFFSDSSEDEINSEAFAKKQPDMSSHVDQEASPKKRKQSSRVSAKTSAKPAMKKKKQPSIEFIRRQSDPLESRIHDPTWLANTWKILTVGIIKPLSATEEESYIYHLQSFGLYILHVVLVVWVIYGTFDLEYNYHSIIVSNMIEHTYFESNYVLKRSIRFKDIRAPQHIWDFIRGVILKIIYPVETTNSTFNSILQQNVIVGVAQLRQVKVKKDTCESAPMFSDLYKHCYGYAHEEHEDREPFGLNESLPWKYSYNWEKIARGSFHDFSGHGYAMNFSKSYAMTLLQLNELEDNQWIRLGTRAVFLDFTMYCPNTNTFLLVKLTFEIMPWGAVSPSSYIYSIKLLACLHHAAAFLLLGVDIVLLGYTIGLNYILFLRLKRTGMNRLFAYNNLLDTAIISSTYATLCVHIAMLVYTDQKLDSLVSTVMTSQHPTFGVLIATYELYLRIAAILLLCIVLKLIRYTLYFNRTAKLVICAIRNVKGELICFTIVNLTIMFALAIVSSTVYGQVREPLSTPMGALVILIYHHCRAYRIFNTEKAGSLPFPFRVIAYFTTPAAILYINCISQQTYVALMVHGWKRAAREFDKDPLKIKVNEMVCTGTVEILEKLKLFKWANKLQEYHIIKMNEDDYYSFTQILRRYGWKELEKRLLLRKYGIRKGDDLTIDELFEVYQEFWVRNTLFFEVAGHEELKRDLEYTQRMMKYCEATVADLKSGIEMLSDLHLGKHVKNKDTSLSPDSQNSLHEPSPRKSLIGRFWT